MAVPSINPGRASVSAADWTRAAATAFAVGGLAAVRVEPLARQLGVTKGSFYWHFADREALVAAVVEQWENEFTDAMIRESERGDSPHDRLRRLLVAVSGRMTETRGQQLLYLEAEEAGVRAAVERVTNRRLDYLADLLGELGLTRTVAERRSALALSASLGMQQLITGAPGAIDRPALHRPGFTDFLYAALTAPEGP